MTAVAHVMEDRVVAAYLDRQILPRGTGEVGQDAHRASGAAADSAESAIAAALRARLGADRHELWFEGKSRLLLDGGTLEVVVGNGFAARWIGAKLRADLLDAAREVLGHDVELVIRVDERLASPAARPADMPLPLPRPAGDGDGDTRAGARVASGFAPSSPLRYTLEEFVVGPSNQLAYHAACRVAERPGREFNPLFIHGHCGLGKTHLLQGICHRFARLHPGKKWLYVTGEQFTNDFLDAIRNHKTDAFRRRLRSAELLVLDDVHFLGNKKATQEEFLHTFNQIDASGRQIVLASDCAPRQIQALSEQLSSRFVSGMVLRIDSPDLPTRLDILRRRVAKHGWNISDTVLMHIARTATSSVRELEGLLLQVVAGIDLINTGHADAAAAAPGGHKQNGGGTGGLGGVLAGLRQRMAMRGPLPVERIVAAVAEHFALAPETILGNGREKIVSAARAIAMHLARQHSGMSFPEIGRAFGGKNHSTVIAACQRVEALITTSQLLCWTTPEGPHNQSISDILHDLEAAIRRAR